MRVRRPRGPRVAAPPRAVDRGRWRTYQSQVEPALLSRPRLHRFAQPPVTSRPEQPGCELAVWIEGPEASEAVQRTVASLRAGTRPPGAVLHGSLSEAMTRAGSRRLVLLRAGDELAPVALERLGQAAELAADARVLTCDSDERGRAGRRRRPRLRPGPSPDRWLAVDDSGPLLVVDLDAAAGALPRLGDPGGWRHELALRLAGPDSARHAHVPMLLCHESSASQRPALADLEELLHEWEPDAHLKAGEGVRHVRRPLRSEPAVEVIVCFRDQPELLERCVGSLLETTVYDRLRLTLVDNGSERPETSELLERLQRDPKVEITPDGRPFHFAALNNAAARRSDADVLVFLNNDTEVIQADWLTLLLEEALRPPVGAVAPLLLYGSGAVQHAGAAVGLHDYAGHPFAGLQPGTPTPFGRADEGTRNWLAVTAACLAVERQKFLAVGGFDESFVVAGNDVDLGLRLTGAGHRSLCVSHARLIHHESRSRGRRVDPGDFAASERSYGAFRTEGDPFYSPSLSLRATDCRLRQSAEGL